MNRKRNQPDEYEIKDLQKMRLEVKQTTQFTRSPVQVEEAPVQVKKLLLKRRSTCKQKKHLLKREAQLKSKESEVIATTQVNQEQQGQVNNENEDAKRAGFFQGYQELILQKNAGRSPH